MGLRWPMNIVGLIPEFCNATVAPDYLYDKPMVSSSNEQFSIVHNAVDGQEWCSIWIYKHGVWSQVVL